MPAEPVQPSQRGGTLLALCVILGIVALLLLIYAGWLVITLPSGWAQALLAALVALVTGAAAWGLYRRKRWGVLLFGGLSLAGSINHLSNTILRFPDMSRVGTADAAAAIISVLGAFLIPFGLILVNLALWKEFNR